MTSISLFATGPSSLLVSFQINNKPLLCSFNLRRHKCSSYRLILRLHSSLYSSGTASYDSGMLSHPSLSHNVHDVPYKAERGLTYSKQNVDRTLHSQSADVQNEDTKSSKRELVEEFCSRFRRADDYVITFEELASLYDFPLDKFQRVAIESFLEGYSVVASAPTSSGKTLIADAAAAVTLARGKRLFYSTPLKALSNQKFREFRDAFGEKHVGLLTGDAMINSEAKIVILTAEILRNMLYQSVGAFGSGSRLGHVDVIVLDEVHYLSDITRGTVWEEIVIYCPTEVQLICLSATIANPEELSGWIRQVHGPTKLVTSHRRPVPLTWHFSRKAELLPLFNERATKMNMKLSIARYPKNNLDNSFYFEKGIKAKKARKKGKGRATNKDSVDLYSELSSEDVQNIRRSQVPYVKDTLSQLIVRDMLPAIWFIFSRKGCDDAIRYLRGFNLLTEHEQDKVQDALNKFSTVYPEAVREDATEYLFQGIAVHHAGCLPLWKSFVEDLFQDGLIKVVFATETLAAGINMPARTTVISSLSKRGSDGHGLLNSNSLFQMAGRAGRRGIDNQGHVVIMQTPFEGAEECCKLVFAGADPLVSQFSASYGMVLNLLGARKVVSEDKDGDGIKVVLTGYTLQEARALVERSFGNYLSNDVMIRAKEKLKKLQQTIQKLEAETNEKPLDDKLRETLRKDDCKNAYNLLEQLKELNQEERRLYLQLQQVKVTAMKALLEKSSEGIPKLICLHYKDEKEKEHLIPALCMGKFDCSSCHEPANEGRTKNRPDFLAKENEKMTHWGGLPIRSDLLDECDMELSYSYYAALGADSNWYIFSENWVQSIYNDGHHISGRLGDVTIRDLMRNTIERLDRPCKMLATSEFGDLLYSEGSRDTWQLSLEIPLVNNLSEEDKINLPDDYNGLLKNYRDQTEVVSSVESELRATKWYQEAQRLSNENKVKEKKMLHLKAKSDRIRKRISQIEPAGWREFLLVGRVLHEVGALDLHTGHLFPLGETASRIRGINELWLAMAVRSDRLIGLKPAELSAVCGSLVSEGIKIRPGQTNSCPYEASKVVMDVLNHLDEIRMHLFRVQKKYYLEIPCDLDLQLPAMVEAWTLGLSWKEVMVDAKIDDGDFARLLRRTIDLLAQIPQLPNIDHSVRKVAKLAADAMNRPPISDLVA